MIELSKFTDIDADNTTGTASVILNLPKATDEERIVKLISKIEGLTHFGYNEIKVPANDVLIARSALENAITRANIVIKVSVSVDGKDILSTDQWTTEDVKSTFEEAIKAAQAVLDKEAKVERISGTNRNATAVAVAKAFFPEAEQAVFVNGDDNQLVLVAGTYAGSQNAPVILVGQKDVPKPAKEYLPNSAIKDGTVIGSVESVEEIVRLQLEELVK